MPPEAEFPNGLPWEGGGKVWSEAIYILEGNQWRRSSTTLPMHWPTQLQ
ncbi:MAG: hypothetical protein R3C61_07180 [Bacteroidia bacterium]